MITAFSGTSSDRNTTISSRNDSDQHGAEEERDALAQEAGEVDVGGDDAGDVDVGAGGVLDGREDVVAEAVDELVGGLVLRAAWSATTYHSTAVLVLVGHRRRARRRRRSRRPTAVVDGAERRRGRLPPADLGHEEQRAVEALAEAVDQQVVGLLGGGVVGEVALVGEAEAQAEHGSGQHEQDDRARRGPPATGGAG